MAIKLWDKNDNYITIEISRDDLNKIIEKNDALQLSRKLATRYNNVYSYSIFSELCNVLGL